MLAGRGYVDASHLMTAALDQRLYIAATRLMWSSSNLFWATRMFN